MSKYQEKEKDELYWNQQDYYARVVMDLNIILKKVSQDKIDIELPKLVSNLIKYYYERTEWAELLEKRYKQIERAELRWYMNSREYPSREERFERFVREQQKLEYNKKYKKYFK